MLVYMIGMIDIILGEPTIWRLEALSDPGAAIILLTKN